LETRNAKKALRFAPLIFSRRKASSAFASASSKKLALTLWQHPLLSPSAARVDYLEAQYNSFLCLSLGSLCSAAQISAR
jgi:hypothetical protein